MTITLINKETKTILQGIQKKHPVLTYLANGYDTPNITEQNDIDAVNIINGILSNHIDGFSSFTNFVPCNDERIKIRLQYNYNYDGGGIPFTGVGYIYLDELHRGFNSRA